MSICIYLCVDVSMCVCVFVSHSRCWFVVTVLMTVFPEISSRAVCTGGELIWLAGLDWRSLSGEGEWGLAELGLWERE